MSWITCFFAIVLSFSTLQASGIAITDTPADISGILSAHNTYRAKHGAGPLTWDATLASNAAAYAQQCKYQHSSPSDRNDAGENLAAFSNYPLDTTYRTSAEDWYNEVKLYNYDNPGSVPFAQIGHFTQMVWLQTTKLGCGRAQCPASTSPGLGSLDWTYVVCRYAPAGNIMDSGSDQWRLFKINVLPAGPASPSPPPSPSPPVDPIPSPIPPISSPSPVNPDIQLPVSPSSPPPTNGCTQTQGIKVVVQLKNSKKCTEAVVSGVGRALVDVIKATNAYCSTSSCSQDRSGSTVAVWFTSDLNTNTAKSRAASAIKNGKLKKAVNSYLRSYLVGQMTVCAYPSSTCTSPTSK